MVMINNSMINPDSRYRVVGNSEPRLESVAKVTGTAIYTTDISLPGMVYGKILRSPHAHARVISIDVNEAVTVPGVLGILTFKDVPDILYNCSGLPPSDMTEIKDERILTAEPKYVGDRIAAVVAISEAACAEALLKIKVAYEVLKSLFTIEEALCEGAPLVQGLISTNNIGKSIIAEEGDVEQGFEEADHVFEQEYRTVAVQHVALEPTGCVCHYTHDDKLIVWGTTQTPFQDRRLLGELTCLPQNRIRIIRPTMGGAFGGRQQIHHQPICTFLSKMVRRPVKMIYSREEEMYASSVRHGSVFKLRIGVNNDKTLASFHVIAFINTGGYMTLGPNVLNAMSKKIQYRTPHYKYEGYCVYTNAPVAGAMRGYGNPQFNFARETLINEICDKLKWNPVEFRLKNHLQVGDRIPTLSATIQSCNVEECTEAAIKIKDGLLANSFATSECSKKCAWGVAFGSHSSGIGDRDQGAAVIIANDDGSVNLLVGAADLGQGSDTVLAQIAAEELGLTSTQVEVNSTCTDSAPYDTGTFASRQVYVSGNAVLRASYDIKEAVKQKLSAIYDVEIENITLEGSTYVINNSSQGIIRLSFAEAVRQAGHGTNSQQFVGTASYKPTGSPPPFAVCLAQVELDNDTGIIKVPNIVIGVDAGKPLNPDIVEGQVHGAVSMGVGFTLIEAIRIDRKLKKPLESDLLYYKIQCSLDTPEIHVYLANGHEPSGPFGAKSVGEVPVVPIAAAIVDALNKVTGTWIRELPLIHSYKSTP